MIDEGTRRTTAIPADAAVIAGPGTVTSIAGLTFLVSDERGDIASGPVGLIVRDTRHLSRYQLTINGEPFENLSAAIASAREVTFHGLVRYVGHPDPPLEVERRRVVVDGGFDETVTLRWWGEAPGSATVGLTIDCDFADIFDVRNPNAPVRRAGSSSSSDEGVLTISSTDGYSSIQLRLSPAPVEQIGQRHRWAASLRRGRDWTLRVAARVPDGAEDAPAVSMGADAAPIGVVIQSDPRDFAVGCRASLADFARLTLSDPLVPERRLLAAGIPWFVALFGRDSLIAGYQQRAFDLQRMVETLGALAARQGEVVDPGNDEEPGKILHEVRFTHHQWLGAGTAGGRRPYFGSIDATPLFLIMIGVARRWGASRDAIGALLPAATAALRWMREHGDRDGDGFIEYAPGGSHSLRNQGWKDSENSVQHADGHRAGGPIALVEVQGYAYCALREMSQVFAWLGDDRRADEAQVDADSLRARIRQSFWVDGDPGYYALALDGEKRQVDAVTSNMAHLLWCGVPGNEEAHQIAAHLRGDDLSSGWGLRTLSRSMAGYNPISYHAGSVWPHDTALACEGLRRYGLDDDAMALAGNLLEALAVFEHRLPELFGGHARATHPLPVPYPSACRPQAWSAGVPLTFVPMFLGLEPDLADRTLSLAPRLPDQIDRLTVHGLPLAGGRLSVDVTHEGTTLSEMPSGVRVELRPSG